MRIHWGATIVILVIGYVLGVKFPQWGGKLGLS